MSDTIVAAPALADPAAERATADVYAHFGLARTESIGGEDSYGRELLADAVRYERKSRTTLLRYGLYAALNSRSSFQGGFPLALLSDRGKAIFDRIKDIVGRAPTYRNGSAAGLYLKFDTSLLADPRTVSVARDYCEDEGFTATVEEQHGRRITDERVTDPTTGYEKRVYRGVLYLILRVKG